METTNLTADMLTLLRETPPWFRPVGDGRGLWVYRMLYTYKLVIGTIGDFGYDDHWCYKDRVTALLAFHTWNPLTEAEPGRMGTPPAERTPPLPRWRPRQRVCRTLGSDDG